jgi:hypothetical protein
MKAHGRQQSQKAVASLNRVHAEAMRAAAKDAARGPTAARSNRLLESRAAGEDGGRVERREPMIGVSKELEQELRARYSQDQIDRFFSSKSHLGEIRLYYARHAAGTDLTAPMPSFTPRVHRRGPSVPSSR